MTVPDEAALTTPNEQRTTMSTERDKITDLLVSIPWRSRPADQVADAILAAGYRKPRTITTVEELDALPEGSVVLGRGGDSFQFDGDYWRLAGYGDDFRCNEIDLPATVLHEVQA